MKPVAALKVRVINRGRIKFWFMEFGGLWFWLGRMTALTPRGRKPVATSAMIAGARAIAWPPEASRWRATERAGAGTQFAVRGHRPQRWPAGATIPGFGKRPGTRRQGCPWPG